MSKRKKRFARLGEHEHVNRAKMVRDRAAAGDKEAIAEAARIDLATSPDVIRETVWDILRHHLADCAALFQAAGEPPPPRLLRRTPAAYADALDDWADGFATLALDTLMGRHIQSVRLVAHVLRLLDENGAHANRGFMLGYGLAQNHFLALREFIDGPDLAREKYNAEGRSTGGKVGGKGKRDAIAGKTTDAWNAFATARQVKPSITMNSWALKHAHEFDVSKDTLRRWLARGQKLGKF